MSTNNNPNFTGGYMHASTRSAWISGIAFVCLSAISAAQTVVSQTGVGNTLDSRQTLVLAKTATIVAQSGEVSQTGRWMMDPNPERAANALQKALEKWGRLKLVDEAGQADLVLLIVEGNRSSLFKKGELFERLVVLPGGPGTAQDKAALWQEEAKEGLGGRPAGKLVDHLRKQIEDYEKAGAGLTSGAVSQSEPAKAAVPPNADAVAKAEPSTIVDAKTTPPSQTITPAEARRADPLPGSRLENRMLQPVPDKFAPSAELLKAKTAAVVSFGPQPESGTKAAVVNMLTKTSSHKRANAQRAREDVEKQIRKWNRYALVDTPNQADIVIGVREWNHIGIFGRERLVCRMVVFKGGADFEQKLEMLWAEEYETDFGYTTKLVAKDLQSVVEKLAKQTRAE
jgi:hypothetical protein